MDFLSQTQGKTLRKFLQERNLHFQFLGVQWLNYPDESEIFAVEA